MTAEVIDFAAARLDRLRRDVRRQAAEAERLYEQGRQLAEALRIALAQEKNDG